MLAEWWILDSKSTSWLLTCLKEKTWTTRWIKSWGQNRLVIGLTSWPEEEEEEEEEKNHCQISNDTELLAIISQEWIFFDRIFGRDIKNMNTLLQYMIFMFLEKTICTLIRYSLDDLGMRRKRLIAVPDQNR